MDPDLALIGNFLGARDPAGQRVARGTAPADTAQDEALVKRFGASIVVPRGDAAIRGPYDAAPGGVETLEVLAVCYPEPPKA